MASEHQTVRETVLAELTGRDLGYEVRFADQQGVLVRVLHEMDSGGTNPSPTYLRLLTAGRTETVIGRWDPETPVIVEPVIQVVDAD